VSDKLIWCSRDTPLRGLVVVFETNHQDDLARFYNEMGMDVYVVGTQPAFQPLGCFAAAKARRLRDLPQNGREYPIIIFDGGAAAVATKIALRGHGIGAQAHLFLSGKTSARQWRALDDLKRRVDGGLETSHDEGVRTPPPLLDLFNDVQYLRVDAPNVPYSQSEDWMRAHHQFGSYVVAWAQLDAAWANLATKLAVRRLALHQLQISA